MGFARRPAPGAAIGAGYSRGMNSPQARAALAGVPAYVPGKPPAARDGLPTYKLSSNENPYPPLPGVLEEAARVAASMNRYPDMGCVALYDALSTRLEVASESLAAGTGSVSWRRPWRRWGCATTGSSAAPAGSATPG